MPKGIAKTDEEVAAMPIEKQIRRKRDSLRICAKDAQARADKWDERHDEEPTDYTEEMIRRSQLKADEYQARYEAFVAEHPPAPRKKALKGKLKKVELEQVAEALLKKTARKRKPLTQAQKDARNAKARARRAAKRA